MNIRDVVQAREALLFLGSDGNIQRWIQASLIIGAPAATLVSHVQDDGFLDTELRLIEDQFRADASAFEDTILTTYYIRQCRYWFLSLYENIRTYLALVDKKPHLVQYVDLASVKRLLGTLSLVRIPMAKLQPAGAHKKGAPRIETASFPPRGEDKFEVYEMDVTPYTPVVGFNPDTGSGVWAVIDVSSRERTREVYRRAVSDEFLQIFSRPEKR